MKNENLKHFINNELPIEGQWWNESNADTFHEASEKLLAKGISADEIKELFQSLYTAVSNEFGN
jgi:hypothetical protein